MASSTFSDTEMELILHHLQTRAPEYNSAQQNSTSYKSEDSSSSPTILQLQGIYGPSSQRQQKSNQPPNTVDARGVVPIPDAYPDPGPLTLLLNNCNNNNNSNQSQPAPDTLDPRGSVFELKTHAQDDEALPFLLTLLLNNQNDNQAGNPPPKNQPQPAPDTLDPRGQVFEVKPAEDGPFLLTLLLNNQNNNQANYGKEPQPAPDTVDPRGRIVFEVKPDQDGPLLLALASANLNNQNDPKPDTVAPKSVAVELKGDIPEHLVVKQPLLLQVLANNNAGGSQNVPVADTVDSKIGALSIEEELETPMLLTLLLNNQNNNNNSQQQPAPDTVDVRRTALELGPQTITVVDPHGTNSVLKLRAFDTNTPVLEPNQLQFFKENGYLVIPDALPDSTISELIRTVKNTTEKIFNVKKQENVQVHDFRPGQESYVSPCGRALVTLNNSGFDTTLEPIQRIQRIGCGLHRIFPPFRRAVMSQFHTNLARDLGFEDPRITQSIVIAKPAQTGAAVIPHQDGCSNFTEPSTATTFWYALEDATLENGCLMVAPGSHRTEPLRRRVRAGKGGLAEFVDVEEPVYAKIPGLEDCEASLPKKDEDGEYVYEALEIKAGTLVLMHANLFHRSNANTSGKNRIAFNFAVIEGRQEWRADSYLQPYDGWTEFEKLQNLS